MRVIVSAEASEQALAMDAWWREHRPKARDLFMREFMAVRELIAETPTLGTVYTDRSGKSARRVLMPRTKNHVYFEVDEENEQIVVLAVWGAPRGHGPWL